VKGAPHGVAPAAGARQRRARASRRTRRRHKWAAGEVCGRVAGGAARAAAGHRGERARTCVSSVPRSQLRSSSGSSGAAAKHLVHTHGGDIRQGHRLRGAQPETAEAKELAPSEMKVTRSTRRRRRGDFAYAAAKLDASWRRQQQWDGTDKPGIAQGLSGGARAATCVEAAARPWISGRCSGGRRPTCVGTRARAAPSACQKHAEGTRAPLSRTAWSRRRHALLPQQTLRW